jgi:His/Glu/Gln/Arg/opine family amino acid ABC transporter permease subunit
MASEVKEKAKNSARSPLLLVYIGLLTLAAFYFTITVALAWVGDGLEFLQYLMNPEASPLFALSQGSRTAGVDNLVVIVQILEILGYTVLLGISIWLLGALLAFGRGTLRGYQTVLTVAVALPMLSFIFLGDFQYNFYGIVFERYLITFLGIINLLVLLFLAHLHYYPEYRGMQLGELLRDLRVIRVVSQIIFAFIVLFSIQLLMSNIYQSLAEIRAFPTFDFIFRKAGFQINQRPDWYDSDARYGDAFVVGVLNTISVVWIGLVLSTIIGIFLGIFLLSRNWLIRNISNVYVEILRNTPLLVQLIFWYFVVWFGLPEADIALPNESVLVVYLRFFPYLFTFLGVWLYAWRSQNAAPRMLTGVLAGMILCEIVFRVFGDNYFVIIALAVLGAGLIFAARQKLYIPASQEGLALGIGILALSQFAGHLLLDGLAAAGVLQDARFVYNEVMPAFVISRRSFIMPELVLTLRSGIYGLILLLGAVISIALYIYWGRVIERTGRDIPRFFYLLLLMAVFALGGWYLLAQPLPSNLYVGLNQKGLYMIYEAEADLQAQAEAELIAPEDVPYITSPHAFLVRIPERNRFGRVDVGSEISPSYMALLVGLVIYTSAFIGEIVRAGIQAVPYGQIEASRALGLGTGQTLRMIVLPQALRVIIPPLGNQYLNLAKNSSLAVAIAYSDTYQVGTTVMNQSGQSITGFLIILLVYLTMSLVISFFMNIVNARFQLVTR